jgi:hypothetical protein
MDPSLYAVLLLSAAGVALLIGGWIVSLRNK